MKEKRILITGASGFVGHHFIEHVLKNTDWQIVGLDSFRHRGDFQRLTHLLGPRLKILLHDLRGPLTLREGALIGQIDYIVNFASLSHVDAAIEAPAPFIENNVTLMLNILEYARRIQPEKFVQISTDEVFGAAIAPYCHKEWDTILPSNPYSASKAAQEAIAISYWRTYNLPLILTNTMNIFGERQDPEKFIPKCMAKIMLGEEIVIHGREGQIGSRHYLHARNQSDAILHLLQNVDPVRYAGKQVEVERPDRFNIVGDVELDNLSVAQMIARFMGKELNFRFEDFHKTRPGHDLRYALDGTKMRNFGWRAPVAFEESLEKTVHWTLKNENLHWLIAA